MADEAVYIGPSSPAESYLDTEKILAACHKVGADALHPGYGFLSENAVFAAQLADEGITFIGPSSEAIVSMGEKTRAREIAAAAGVPVSPGSKGVIEDLDLALARADEVGFPILLKAAAGGGGKGMRLVDAREDFHSSFAACQREARGAFGDDRVYLEKYIVQPRHVEIQVLADEYGNVVHLGERDCSIQRRHQKVVEETPCPVVRDDVRERMGEVAVALTKAVDYVGAGTVEFLLDADQNFYFMEMNTRLQVEHPITEMITGIDLVHAQLDIAQGEPLPWKQEDIQRRGASIECRIYAEDPANNFLPSPGRITCLRSPTGFGVRDDNGYECDCDVPTYYDPLVSKLVVWADTREAAIARMRRALADYVLVGIRNTIPFHTMVMEHPAFVSGEYTTAFVPEHLEAEGSLCSTPSDELRDVAVMAAAIFASAPTQPAASAASNGNGHAERGSSWRLFGRYRRLARS